MKFLKILSFQTFGVILLIFFTSIAFYPSVFTNSSLYNNVKYIVYFVLLYLAVITKPYNAIHDKRIRIAFLLTLIASLLFLVLFSLNLNIGGGDVMSFYIVLFLLIIGYCLKVDDIGIISTLMIFSVMAIIIGFASLNYYVGSITLTDYMYVVESKNMVGQLVASSSIGVFYVLLTNKRFFILKILLLFLSVFLLIYLHCRTAVLAFLLGTFVIWYKYQKHKDKWLFIFFILIILLFFISPVVDFFETIFVGTKDVNDIDDLSTGRMQRNIDGISFWSEHPFLGELQTPSGIPNIHNYIIKRLVAYGFFSIPVLLIYAYYLFLLLTSWIKNSTLSLYEVGCWMMFIPYFTSLLEPSAPFGPGLIQAIPFLFFGMALRKNRISYLRISN